MRITTIVALSRLLVILSIAGTASTPLSLASPTASPPKVSEPNPLPSHWRLAPSAQHAIQYGDANVLVRWDGGFTSPEQDEIWYIGETYAIRWNGGDPDWHVRLYLIDMETWTTELLIADDIPNSGECNWTIPDSVVPRAKCIYIENVQETDWAYSPVFYIAAAPTPAHNATWGQIKASYR